MVFLLNITPFTLKLFISLVKLKNNIMEFILNSLLGFAVVLFFWGLFELVIKFFEDIFR